MDYDSIEKIAKMAKCGDKQAKEELLEAFKPFILNLSKRTFISGYDKTDIQNECYKILLKSLLKYDITTHKFVAYGTNSIKNGICDLLRKDKKVKDDNDLTYSNVSFNNDIQNIENESYIDPTIHLDNKVTILAALNTLENNEKDMIDFIFYKNKSLKEYSIKHNLDYRVCLRKKKRILMKLSNKLLN